jgi:hypothetical protein
MNRRKFKRLASLSFALILVLSGIPQGRAQDAKTQYPNMAPLDQYHLIASPADDLASWPSPHTPVAGVGSHG